MQLGYQSRAHVHPSLNIRHEFDFVKIEINYTRGKKI